MTTQRTSTMFTKGTHAEKRARVIELQANFYAAIDAGITGKDKGKLQRLCTVAWEQYTKSCYQHKMTREEMDTDSDAIITEARETAEVMNA